MAKETRSHMFMVRMRPSVKAAGDKAAEQQNQSLASLMEKLLIDHLKANGFLKK